MADERQQVHQFRAALEPRQGQTQGVVKRTSFCARGLFHSFSPAPPRPCIPRLWRKMCKRLIQEGGVFDHGRDRPLDDGPPSVHVGENFQVGPDCEPEGFSAVDVACAKALDNCVMRRGVEQFRIQALQFFGIEPRRSTRDL